MTFIEKYNKIMDENAHRQHAVQQHVVKTYDELLQSVGAFSDEQLAKDNIPLHGLINRPEGGELKKVKEDEAPATKGKLKLDIENPKTKIDLLAKQLKTEFEKDGINKTYRDNFTKGVDGKKFDTFVAIADALDLWREYPPTS